MQLPFVYFDFGMINTFAIQWRKKKVTDRWVYAIFGDFRLAPLRHNRLALHRRHSFPELLKQRHQMVIPSMVMNTLSICPKGYKYKTTSQNRHSTSAFSLMLLREMLRFEQECGRHWVRRLQWSCVIYRQCDILSPDATGLCKLQFKVGVTDISQDCDAANRPNRPQGWTAAACRRCTETSNHTIESHPGSIRSSHQSSKMVFLWPRAMGREGSGQQGYQIPQRNLIHTCKLYYCIYVYIRHISHHIRSYKQQPKINKPFRIPSSSYKHLHWTKPSMVLGVHPKNIMFPCVPSFAHEFPLGIGGN